MLALSKGSQHPNTSRIQGPPSPEMAIAYPGLEDALNHKDACFAEMKGGDTLLIPEGWFHCVEAVGDVGSVSVNHWFR